MTRVIAQGVVTNGAHRPGFSDGEFSASYEIPLIAVVNNTEPFPTPKNSSAGSIGSVWSGPDTRPRPFLTSLSPRSSIRSWYPIS